VSFNKSVTSFDVNATQYVSIFKKDRSRSTFPIRAHFDEARYKKKVPIPSNNTHVAVEGFLNQVEMGDSGFPSLFHVNVDNINFLGRAVIPQSSPDGAQGMCHNTSYTVFARTDTLVDPATSTPRPSRFNYSFDTPPTSSTRPAASTAPAPALPPTPVTPTPAEGSRRRTKRSRLT
jgi:hypothetical protein